MPDTRDIGRTYFHLHRYPDGARPRLLEEAVTQEYEEPFRAGKGYVLAITQRLGLCVGRWEEPRDEEDALLTSMDADEMDLQAAGMREWQRPSEVPG